MPAVLFVPAVPVAWALAIFSLAYFGQQSWSTLVMTLPADIFPRGAVGAVAGLVGFGGAMGGVVFGQVVGALLDAGFGYRIVFTLAGSFHLLAFAVICLTIRGSPSRTSPDARRVTHRVTAGCRCSRGSRSVHATASVARGIQKEPAAFKRRAVCSRRYLADRGYGRPGYKSPRRSTVRDGST